MFAALAAVLDSLEEGVSKRGKVGPFLVLRFNTFSNRSVKVLDGFLPLSFISPPKTLLSFARF